MFSFNFNYRELANVLASLQLSQACVESIIGSCDELLSCDPDTLTPEQVGKNLFSLLFSAAYATVADMYVIDKIDHSTCMVLAKPFSCNVFSYGRKAWKENNFFDYKSDLRELVGELYTSMLYVGSFHDFSGVPDVMDAMQSFVSGNMSHYKHIVGTLERELEATNWRYHDGHPFLSRMMYEPLFEELEFYLDNVKATHGSYFLNDNLFIWSNKEAVPAATGIYVSLLYFTFGSYFLTFLDWIAVLLDENRDCEPITGDSLYNLILALKLAFEDAYEINYCTIEA